MIKDFFRKLHLWVSIPFGLVITVTCFTGALLVFEDDVTCLYYSDIAKVEPQGEPLPLAQLMERVEKAFPGEVEITGVTMFDAPEKAYKVSVSKPHRATYYVDQYTGTVGGVHERLPFFRTTLRLHRWLLDRNPGKGKVFWGKMIVGASTVSFVIILITGLVVWLPKNRKMLRNRLRIVFSKGGNRFLYDLHVAGGFYVLLVLLAMALTGLTWSYRWYSDAFYAVFAKGNGKNGVSAVSGATTLSGGWNKEAEQNETAGKYYPWQQAVAAVVAEKPDYEKLVLSKETVSVYGGTWGNQRACDKYEFDPVDGNLKSVQRYKDNAGRSKVRGWVYSVHVGSWGGLLSRVLAFLSALVGATLPLTGYYFWIRRLYKKRR